MLLFEKYGQHQPLNRQAERFAREGVPLSVSTLADQVGAAAFALMPLYRRIEAHVLAAGRLHGDDTTVPVMARGRTDVARLWVYVRDDAPFGGTDPPAALFHYSRDRRGEHPQTHLAGWSGIFQGDAYGSYGELYRDGRAPSPIREAGCFAHARRKSFELADVKGAARRKSRGERTGTVYPIALEAVKRLSYKPRPKYKESARSTSLFLIAAKTETIGSANFVLGVNRVKRIDTRKTPARWTVRARR